VGQRGSPGDGPERSVCRALDPVDKTVIGLLGEDGRQALADGG
jgi:hypothetical protein